MKIRIPKMFFIDHMERDLPTPAYGKWRGGFVIDTDAPEMPELINDAQHYATDGCDCEPGLKRAAISLLKTIDKEIAAYHALRPNANH